MRWLAWRKSPCSALSPSGYATTAFGRSDTVGSHLQLYRTGCKFDCQVSVFRRFQLRWWGQDHWQKLMQQHSCQQCLLVRRLQRADSWADSWASPISSGETSSLVAAWDIPIYLFSVGFVQRQEWCNANAMDSWDFVECLYNAWYWINMN